MILHCDNARNEWYISTEGSNFLALYMIQNGLCIDCRRCFTTNIMEILACLGLEAVCGIFSNGDLARSLGVNNASFGQCSFHFRRFHGGHVTLSHNSDRNNIV